MTRLLTKPEMQQRVLEVLGRLGPGDFDALVQETLLIHGEACEENNLLLVNVLSQLTGEGKVETDGGWYRLADNYETASADPPREIAARLPLGPGLGKRFRRPRHTAA